jgi:hypothetical protein
MPSRDLDRQGLQRHDEFIVMKLPALADWLAESGLRNLPLEEMIDGFSRRLPDMGVPVTPPRASAIDTGQTQSRIWPRSLGCASRGQRPKDRSAGGTARVGGVTRRHRQVDRRRRHLPPQERRWRPRPSGSESTIQGGNPDELCLNCQRVATDSRADRGGYA